MRASWSSDTGRVRKNNEDKVLADSGRGIFLLADGMGGRSGGEIASELAVTAAYDYLREGIAQADSSTIPRLLAEALAAAHSAVFKRSVKEPALAGMGTTLEIMVVREGTVFICHVGDSRVYLVRGEEVRQLSRDDNMAAWLMEEERVPAEEVPPEARHVLTQAVGPSDSLIPELHTVELAAEDILMLCSDGLTGMLTDREMGEIIRRWRDDLDKVAETLVSEANARGGSDNISVLLVAPESPRVTSPGEKLLLTHHADNGPH